MVDHRISDNSREVDYEVEVDLIGLLLFYSLCGVQLCGYFCVTINKSSHSFALLGPGSSSQKIQQLPETFCLYCSYKSAHP